MAYSYHFRRSAAAEYDACCGIYSCHSLLHDWFREIAEAAQQRDITKSIDAVEVQPSTVLLLGITPTTPETEYGWIEPQPSILASAQKSITRVRKFWEKPSLNLATSLMDRDCLWNSFVMVGRCQTLLELVRDTLPGLSRAFEPIRRFIGTPLESMVVESIYRNLATTDFSKNVLSGRPERLAVLPVRGVAWSDLGRPERVLAIGGAPTMIRSTTPVRRPLVAAAG